MDCRTSIGEIVETARAGEVPRLELTEHLDGCRNCSERWDEEQSLAEPMRNLRLAVRGRRSPDFRRGQLMDEFARIHRRRRRVDWAMRVAATVLVALAAGLLSQTRPHVDPLAAASVADAAPVAVPPEMAGESGFMAVPYAPPLAPGEHVTVVRTEVQAAALNRMGFVVTGMSGNDYSAEIVLGEDGLPRAVRMLGEEMFDN